MKLPTFKLANLNDTQKIVVLIAIAILCALLGYLISYWRFSTSLSQLSLQVMQLDVKQQTLQQQLAEANKKNDYLSAELAVE